MFHSLCKHDQSFAVGYSCLSVLAAASFPCIERVGEKRPLPLVESVSDLAAVRCLYCYEVLLRAKSTRQHTPCFRR